MDSQDQSGAVSRLVRILRVVTRVVQMTPFVYLLFYSLYLLAEPLLDADTPGVFDVVINASPVSVVMMLIIGRVLKLCVWFKTACLMPLLSQIEGLVDSLLFQFTQGEIIIINSCIALLCIVFIISSIRHFAYARQ